MYNEKDLEIIEKDGWAASEKHKSQTSCPFILEAFRERWEKGWLQQKVNHRKYMEEKRRKFYCQWNADIEKWERVNKKTDEVVGVRKKKYSCSVKEGYDRPD